MTTADEPARADRSRLQYTARAGTEVPEAAATPAETVDLLREVGQRARDMADEFTPFWRAFGGWLLAVADREQQHVDQCLADGTLLGAPEPGDEVLAAAELARVWRTC